MGRREEDEREAEGGPGREFGGTAGRGLWPGPTGAVCLWNLT